MAHYRSSVSIEASVHETFAFIRDARNLPKFVERITAAEPLGGDQVRVTLAGAGATRTAEATFRAHESGHRRRVEWATVTEIDGGGGGYHGWLEVDREGEVCSATMELHADEVDGAEVDTALWALKAVVEAK